MASVQSSLVLGSLALALLSGCQRGSSPAADKESEHQPVPAASPIDTALPSRAASPNSDEVRGTELSPHEVTVKCQTVCEKTASLPCVKVPTCIQGCLETYGMPMCRREFGAMLTCSAAARPDQFECGSPDAPALKEDACETEQEHATQCVVRMMESQGDRSTAPPSAAP